MIDVSWFISPAFVSWAGLEVETQPDLASSSPRIPMNPNRRVQLPLPMRPPSSLAMRCPACPEVPWRQFATTYGLPEVQSLATFSIPHLTFRLLPHRYDSDSKGKDGH